MWVSIRKRSCEEAFFYAAFFVVFLQLQSNYFSRAQELLGLSGCYFCRYKISGRYREKNWSWQSRFLEEKPRVAKLSSLYHCREDRNGMASIYCPKRDQNSPAEHHKLADVNYTPFHHVRNCHCTRQPEVKLAPKGKESNNLANKNYSVPQGPSKQPQEAVCSKG